MSGNESHPRVDLRSERGAALFIAVLALALLIVLGVAINAFALLESQIGRAHVERNMVGLIADAGAKHAIAAIGKFADLDTVLLGADGQPNTADDGILDGHPELGPGESIPASGVAFGGGSYTVRVVDDAEPADSSASPGTHDTNGIVLLQVQATGFNGAVATAAITVRASVGWPIDTLTAALTTGNGLRKNSPQGGVSGFDEATAADCPGGGQPPITGLIAPDSAFQFNHLGAGVQPDSNGVISADSSGTFQGDPPIQLVSDPVAALQALGIDWQGILNGQFDYVVDQKPPGNEWPDFSSLPPDAFPSIIVTAPRVDLDNAYSGRGLLVVTEELRLKGGFQWDGLILVGNFMQSNGQLSIRGGMITGLDLLLGRDPATMSISAIGPGVSQVTYNSCLFTAAKNAGGGIPQPPVPIGWVTSW